MGGQPGGGMGTPPDGTGGSNMGTPPDGTGGSSMGTPPDGNNGSNMGTPLQEMRRGVLTTALFRDSPSAILQIMKTNLRRDRR